MNNFAVLFFGRGDTTNAQGAKVSWDIVCRPKKEGGLGISKVEAWNISSLARIVWLLFCGIESLWIAWMNVWFLKGKSFRAVQVPSNCSWG